MKRISVLLKIKEQYVLNFVKNKSVITGNGKKVMEKSVIFYSDFHLGLYNTFHFIKHFGIFSIKSEWKI